MKVADVLKYAREPEALARLLDKTPDDTVYMAAELASHGFTQDKLTRFAPNLQDYWVRMSGKRYWGNKKLIAKLKAGQL